ncbi:hypothetical protein LWI29_029225 [Acer saccharum]|uniref:Uncharacterized protein n=1 Tax=Acer saccharum TaxID=4024 RepID=A0AA39T9Z1_ACESA|nr:hypothetical protein LWI29_029225 [Acer saccharum]KAK1577905.1 hypothetical protein Q3G72_025897 [Acer saccharum]
MKPTVSRGTKGVTTGVNQPKRAAYPPPPPPPPLPLPRFWAKKTATESVTNQEIARFWRQKRIDEEDHLLAAIKAAARIRARNLSEEDYKYFEESLENIDDDVEKNSNTEQDNQNNEVRVGIKDWWTKSKYAYLNQPEINSMDTHKKRTSTYTPSCISYKPVSVYPASLGVF